MRAFAAIILVGLAAAIGCNSSSTSPTNPTSPTSPSTPAATGLPGTWQASRAEYVYGSTRLDAVSAGTTMVLTITSSNTYTMKTLEPGQPEEASAGTWTASTDVLTLRPSGVSWTIQFDMSLNGSSLALNGGHVAYDINGDDRDEECILNSTWVRK